MNMKHTVGVLLRVEVGTPAEQVEAEEFLSERLAALVENLAFFVGGDFPYVITTGALDDGFRERLLGEGIASSRPPGTDVA